VSVAVGGTGVSVGVWVGVSVGGTAVAVGGTGVSVGVWVGVGLDVEPAAAMANLGAPAVSATTASTPISSRLSLVVTLKALLRQNITIRRYCSAGNR